MRISDWSSDVCSSDLRPGSGRALMAFHQTPFDHIGVWSPPMRLIPFLQGTCLVLIEASRFAASSLLIVLGLPLFAFLFLAGWDMGIQIGRASCRERVCK